MRLEYAILNRAQMLQKMFGTDILECLWLTLSATFVYGEDWLNNEGHGFPYDINWNTLDYLLCLKEEMHPAIAKGFNNYAN